MRHYFPDHGDAVRYLTFPYSNEHRVLRTASEHLLTPFLLPLHHIDLLSTAIAPVVNPTRSLVIHMKTMHTFSAPESLGFWPRTYRRLNYQRSLRRADLVIVNSKSLHAEIDDHLQVDPRKVRLIYEAVDHDIFTPGDRDSARARVATFGVTRPFVLFVSSLWRYKNCDGLLHAWRLARDQLAGRQLVIVGAERDQRYASELRELVDELGIGEDVVFVGGVPNEETVHFYRAADLLVYPSFNETFGLPILEAMACACPVVTSSLSSMPEVAGGAAILADPHDPSSIARAMLDGLRSRGEPTPNRGHSSRPAIHVGRHRAGDPGRLSRGRRAAALTIAHCRTPPPQAELRQLVRPHCRGASSTLPLGRRAASSLRRPPSRAALQVWAASPRPTGVSGTE